MLFNPGDVIFVESDQAAGYRTRKKYHICVCGHRGRYFFINSRTWAGSFLITNVDVPALPNPKSHIACNTLLTVSDEYMRTKNAQKVGDLDSALVLRLIDHVNECDVLTEEEKEIAIDGLSGAV